MAGENSTANLNGMFKRVFADHVVDLIPDVAKVARMVPFETNAEIGENYNQPIALQLEHGITTAAAGAGAFTLNAAVAQQTKNAQVDAPITVLRSAVDYESLAKASKKGDKAFERALSFIVKQMVKSIWKREELHMWYGSSALGLGTVGSVTVGGATTYKATITLTAGQWAPGIWAGMEGALVDVYDSTLVTKRNANGDFKIDSVDYDNKKVVVFDSNSTDANAIAATDVIVFKGAVTTEMNGIDKIVSNTGSLYNIDASAFALWKSSVYDVQSTSLTLQKVQSAVSKGVAKGLEEEAALWVSPYTWANLNSDQAALRRYGAEMEDGENGFKKLTMFSQNGKLDIMVSTVVKEGEAWVLPMKRLKKVGSTDVTFNTPSRTDEFFFQLPTQAGVELRAMYQLNLFIETPGYCVKLKNIVNVA